MTVTPITDLQLKAARIAGIAYLITFATLVYVNFGLHHPLIVENNPAETAQNILANEQLFRLGIAGDLFYCIGTVVLLTALYIILKPVSFGLVLAATFFRLVWVLMWIAMSLNLFEVVRLLNGGDYLQVFDVERLQALASIRLAENYDIYYVGLLFGSLASTICAYLWFRSRYIPRSLAIFGIVSSAFCVACTFIYYINPDFDKTVNLWWFDTPMSIFDIVLSFWLLLKGLKRPDLETLKKSLSGL